MNDKIVDHCLLWKTQKVRRKKEKNWICIRFQALSRVCSRDFPSREISRNLCLIYVSRQNHILETSRDSRDKQAWIFFEPFSELFGQNTPFVPAYLGVLNVRLSIGTLVQNSFGEWYQYFRTMKCLASILWHMSQTFTSLRQLRWLQHLRYENLASLHKSKLSQSKVTILITKLMNYLVS